MASDIGEAVLGKICEVAVEMALQKLSEAKLVLNFRKDFIWLNNQLKYVRGFLKDADQQCRGKEDVKRWLENIRVISLLAEFICEECAVQSVYGNNAQSCGLSCNQLIFRYRIGRKIKDIKDRIRSTIEDGNELKLLYEVSSASANEASPSTSGSVEWKRSTLLPSDSDSVGIESKVDDMLRLLDDSGSPVIGVVGMERMSKTHLLQHVFHNIKGRYEKSIWLSVSQSYSIYNLQKDLVFQLDKKLSEEIKNSGVSEQVLALLIHEKVQGKRYLVVLHDVWRASREEDLLASLGLRGGNDSPCKIVVTTRSREVCINLNAEIYDMQYLSDEESWKLFCVYAFEGKREAEQYHLEEVGRKIVKQCGNLPLAIKTIAASLAKITMPRDWESKLHELERVITANVDDPIRSILRLSYDSLPARLKACFAYLPFYS